MSQNLNSLINYAQIKNAEVEALFRKNLHRIVPVDLDKEMRKSFIDYAMSVISDRALPDIRDGLKPVHRRIIYAMYTLGLTPDKSYRKCANTVGDVLGKFHPHGDASVYEALVRLAQDFSMRHTLVDGYGNFGSRDGDPPAAYRYTEARLDTISMEIIRDIHKDAVDFKPNFDEHEMEPCVLPSRFPNLLVNGSTGIAVGMSTNIPPHNLAETISAVIHLMKNKEADLDEIMQHLKGPDFPTAGTIIGINGIREAYSTGRGRIVVRGKATIEQMGNQRSRIVVSDLPYMVNKARLIEKIADLSKDKKIEGISFVRDESDRKEPIRIVIELKRDANAEIVLNQLYKSTQLQDAFSVNLLALVPDSEGRYEPQNLTLLDCLHHYIKHQKDVVLRRTKFDLNKALARQHILEGLRIAFVHIDEIIETIKQSANSEDAKVSLMEKFGFSERQAQHIGEMRLFRLTNLEQFKIETEFKEVSEKIIKFNEIIENEATLISVIEEELLEISKKYSNPRRTDIDLSAEEDIEDESLIQEKSIVVTLTKFGYIKRQATDVYRTQKRGGKGISGLSIREEDYVQNILTGSTHNTYLFLTNLGRAFRLKGYQIPEASRQAKGTPIVNLLELGEGESVKAILPVDQFLPDLDLVLATERGNIQRTSLINYANISKSGIKAILLRDDDSLVGAEIVAKNNEVVLCSQKANLIRFAISQVRRTGRNSQGVRGMRLSANDKVVSMALISSVKTLLAVSELGLGKKTSFEEYTPHNRGGKGIKTYKLTEKTGNLISVASVSDNQDILLLNEEGVFIRIHIADIPLLSRATQGVKLMNTYAGRVVDIAIVEREDDEGENEEVELETLSNDLDI